MPRCWQISMVVGVLYPRNEGKGSFNHVVKMGKWPAPGYCDPMRNNLPGKEIRTVITIIRIIRL